MSRLTAKDLEILKARGYANGLTTFRDDEVSEFVKPEEFSMKPTKKKVAKKVKKAPKPKHPLVGKLLHTSWGYDMTINDFCKIIEVSPTGKTVKCMMVRRSVTGDPWYPGGNGKAKAGTETYGPVFRLKLGEGWNGGVNCHGSYPYCVQEGEEKNWKAYMGRKGYFSVCSEDEEFYENRCD